MNPDSPGIPVGRSAVGRRSQRPDTAGQVTGRLKYAEDFRLPGQLQAKVLRSTQAHARIAGLDISRALAAPGVKAVATAADLALNSFGPTHQDQPVLAQTRVRHRGDPLAAVAARTEEEALAALELIKVDYEPLPAVFDPLEAMKPEAPRLYRERPNVYARWRICKGDPEAALASAHLVVEERYETQMVEHAPMEPHSALAYYEPNGKLHIISTLGRITLARADIGRVLGLPLNRIRVTCPQAGGNFGGKNEMTIEPILAVLAKKSGCPVRGTYTRREEFEASTTRHPFIMDYTTGVDREGLILARKIRLVADGGAYCSWSQTTLGKATILSAGPYRIKNLLAEGVAVYTNKTMTGAMRGFGGPQVCFAYESHLDQIAARLGLDPLAIRLKNALREGDPGPTGQPLHSVAAIKTMTGAAELFGWKETPR